METGCRVKADSPSRLGEEASRADAGGVAVEGLNMALE